MRRGTSLYYVTIIAYSAFMAPAITYGIDRLTENLCLGILVGGAAALLVCVGYCVAAYWLQVY